MSEPVGNMPRGSEIPGNSHKAREAESTSEAAAEKEPVQKIIEGKVVRKKAPWYKRAKQNMIADDAEHIGDFVISDVVVPAIKNMIYDAALGALSATLFGAAARSGRRGVGGASRGPVSTIRNKYHDVPTERPRALTRESRARHDFDEIVLDSRTEAVDVITLLQERIDRYRVASVADLYDALGVTGDFAAQYWGWTNLRDADVRQTRAGFLLDLPSPESLR